MAKKIKKKAAKKAAPRKAARKAVKKTAKKAVKKAAKKAPVAVRVKSKKKAAPARKKAAAPAAVKAPAPRMSASTYLTFNGNCEEAFNFYRSVFGGEFPYVGRFKDVPPSDHMPPTPPEEANLVMHVSLQIGDSWIMGSDTSAAHGLVNFGNNFSISLNTTSRAEADKLYTKLSAGGQQTMPMSQTFWDSYFGMLIDKFNINWMISFEQPKK